MAADGLEDVTQRFDADMADYIAGIDAGAEEARKFAEDNEAAKITVDSLRDHIGELAAAAGFYRDELGKLRDAQGRFASESVLADLALGHTRDEALEAAAAMRGLKDEEDKAARGGLLSRLGSLLGGAGGGAGGGLSGILGNIPLVPEGGGLPAQLGVLGLMVDAAAALSVELTGVLSGFAAAGAGAGAFALLAMPAFHSVSSAYTQIQSDQQAYDRALTKTARNDALKHLQQDYANLSGPQKDAVTGIQSLVGEYHKLSSAFTPEAFKVFSGFLQLANNLLPDVTPFAKTFADSISGLLDKVSKFTGSKGFKDWLSDFQKLEGPSIGAIGTGVGHLAVNIGKLLTTMSSKDDVNAINIAFSVIDGLIIGFTRFVQGAMRAWDLLTTAWDKSVDFTRRMGHDTASGFDTMRHGAATAGHDTAGAFDTMRHKIATEVDGALTWVKTHWKAIASFLADPVATAVFEIRTHTHQIAHDFDTLRHDAARILDGMRRDAAKDWDGMRHDAAHAFDLARHDVAADMDGLLHDVERYGDGVLRWFASLPGRILGYLTGLPGQMQGAGRNAILGLLHGIVSAAAAIPSVMRGLAGDVEHYFTDPLSIFSPSMVFFRHGVNTVQGYINGVKSMLPQLQALMRGAGGQVASSGALLGTGPAGSTAHNFNVNVNASGALGAVYQSPEFQQYLQRELQEAVLRYQVNNPGNGLSSAWGTR